MEMETLVALGETAEMVPVESVDSPDSDVKLMLERFLDSRVCVFLFSLNRVECQII